MELTQPMSFRIICALLAFATLSSPLAASAQSAQATLTGRILDLQQGLAIPAATVELERGSTTDAQGAFTFTNQTPGEYSLLVTAGGYDSGRVPAVFLIAGQTVELQTALI